MNVWFTAATAVGAEPRPPGRSTTIIGPVTSIRVDRSQTGTMVSRIR